VAKEDSEDRTTNVRSLHLHEPFGREGNALDNATMRPSSNNNISSSCVPHAAMANKQPEWSKEVMEPRPERQSRRVGKGSSEMMIIIAIIQKFTGGSQKKIKAIADQATERHDSNNDETYTHLPNAILRDVPDKLHLMDYLLT
jgi:hypothetical protein